MKHSKARCKYLQRALLLKIIELTLSISKLLHCRISKCTTFGYVGNQNRESQNLNLERKGEISWSVRLEAAPLR